MGNLIKQKNLNLIREILLREDRATKAGLSQQSGLSVVTVNSLLQTLIGNGEILECGLIRADQGRPSMEYCLNRQAALGLAVSMCENKGVDTVRYMICDLRGEVLETRMETLELAQVGCLDQMISDLLKAYPAVNALCVGIPGVQVKNRVMVSDYETLYGADWSSYLEQRTGRSVQVVNDINAALTGYVCRRHTQKGKILAGIYCPEKYPPGGAAWVNGALVTGRDGLAGEIAGMEARGFWETYGVESAQGQEAVIRLIRAYMFLLNPYEIVVYGRLPGKEMERRLKQFSQTCAEEAMLPAIEWISDINTDFQNGLIRIMLMQVRGKLWKSGLNGQQ